MAAGDPISEIISPAGEQQLDRLETTLTNAVEQLTKFGQIAKGITVDFKGVKDFATLADLQAKITTTTEKMTKAQRDYSDEIDKAQVKEIKAVDTAVAAYEKKGAAAEKAALREEIALEKLNNEYETLKRSYKTASDAAKQLGVAYGVTSDQFKKASSSAKGMYNQLLQVEMAVGQGQRAVGQYNQAAFAMQQVLRETPSLANGFRVWLSAIGNNLVGVTDAIKNLKATNEALAASGQKTIPIWKAFAGTIFSWETAMLAGITVLTILVNKLGSLDTKNKEAAKSTQDLAEALKNVSNEAELSYNKQTSLAKSLVAVVQDASIGEKTRVAAMKQLIEMYPQYLKVLTIEDALKGKAFEQLELIKEEIGVKTEVEAKEAKINALLKTRQDLYNKLNGLTPMEGEENSFNVEEQISAIDKQVAEAEKALTAQRLALLTYPQKDKDSKRNGLSEKTPELNGEKELAQAKAALREKELTAVAEQQKAIADNVENSIQKRLVANDVYYATLIEKARNEGKAQESVEQSEIKASLTRTADLVRRRQEILAGKGTISEDQRAKALSDIGLQLKNEETKRKAHNVNLLTIDKTFQADAEKQIIEATQRRVEITKSGNEEWVKAQEDAFATAKHNQLIGYLTEENLLKHQYDAKLISRRKYEQELKELQHKQRITELEADVEYDNRMLSSTQITADQRLRIQEKLIKDEKALEDARAGITEPIKKRQSGRITDSVATLFGGSDFLKSDLDLQQRYLQSFYDATVNLAKNAAAQILEVNNQRVQKEINDLDHKQDSVRSSYQFELEAINLTSRSQVDKDNAVTQLRQQQAVQEQQYEAKRRQLAIQQARFQRTASLASAISNTAVGVTKALAELGPLAAIVVPIIIASGAAQVAAISSAPIPQYAKGTEYHKGGEFIAGDGNEIEYIQAPNKPGYWSAATPTPYFEQAGTTVTPLSRFVRNIDVTSGYKPGSISDNRSDEMKYQHLANLIGEKYAENTELLAYVISRNGYRPQKQESFRDALKGIANTQGY